ncbi:hypothetical protein L1281_001689 [Neisseria sp. HSC-16F19]|nr:hypothetical protein [Neisseria sp. HSC-16F19]MCP2041095.1 hypothetical protein [Neisseria sp. HSC-16F19]
MQAAETKGCLKIFKQQKDTAMMCWVCNPTYNNMRYVHGYSPIRWRSRTERGFSGKRANLFEQRSCELLPARKTVRREGSLRSKPATAAAFLLPSFLWRHKEKKVAARP